MSSSRTWWGQRWLDLVAPTFPARTSRFERGEVDARTGRVSGLTVEPGRTAARVQGDHVRPYSTTVEVPVLEGDRWRVVARQAAERARIAAELLQARLPEELEDLVRGTGASLFPEPETVVASCSCGSDQPCRHVAALHHAFVRASEQDPFTLLAIRGREQGRFLAEVRAARAGSDAVVVPEAAGTVSVEELGVDGFVDARGDLAGFELHPHLTDDPAALLDRLGAPPGLGDTGPLRRLVGNAAATAWRLAAGAGAAAADDELLLAELRARRTATAGELADALGWEPERTLALLTSLYEAGAVLRTGKDLAARYRAS